MGDRKVEHAFFSFAWNMVYVVAAQTGHGNVQQQESRRGLLGKSALTQERRT